MARIKFENAQSEGKRAIVVSFDLSGFSDFCNHPEAHAVLPKFISAVFDEVHGSLMDGFGEYYTDPTFENLRVLEPQFMKYTGDGAIMLWLISEDMGRRQRFCTHVVRAMRQLQQRLHKAMPRWEVEWQVHSLPNRARFGIATGLVYPLKEKSYGINKFSTVDYAGYCINLAVRLQNHCPEIGFLIHETVLPQIEGLTRWTTRGMKGMRSEPVLIFAEDIALELKNFKGKFLPASSDSEIKMKAMQPYSDAGTQSALSQARHEAHFVGGPLNGVVLFLNRVNTEYVPPARINDSLGDGDGSKRPVYQLTSKGPPLIYHFARNKKAK